MIVEFKQRSLKLCANDIKQIISYLTECNVYIYVLEGKKKTKMRKINGNILENLQQVEKKTY